MCVLFVSHVRAPSHVLAQTFALKSVFSCLRRVCSHRCALPVRLCSELSFVCAHMRVLMHVFLHTRSRVCESVLHGCFLA